MEYYVPNVLEMHTHMHLFMCNKSKNKLENHINHAYMSAKARLRPQRLSARARSAGNSWASKRAEAAHLCLSIWSNKTSLRPLSSPALHCEAYYYVAERINDKLSTFVAKDKVCRRNFGCVTTAQNSRGVIHFDRILFGQR